MPAVAVTGPSRRLEKVERNLLIISIESLKAVEEFWSGAAAGVDCLAAGAALRAFPKAKHRIVIPRWKGGVCPHYTPGVRVLREIAAREGAELEVMGGPKDGKDEAAGYLRRNDLLAEKGSHLLAYVSSTNRYRSGEWATIDRFRKLDKAVKLVPLDGSTTKILQ
jgi:hypothetical protein